MLASAVALGLAAGLVIRRDWRPLLHAQIRWLPLLIASLVTRVVASLIGDAGYAIYVGALTATTVAAAVNYRLPGAMLIAFGGALNLIVVLLNGGMPVDPIAVSGVGTQMPRDALHVALHANTRLPALADVIPVAIARSVYSIGDILIAAGGFLVPFSISIRR